jgi:hypothetical protein
MPDSPAIIPPMLYLPVMNHPEGGQYAVVRDLADGRTALLVYTALDRLADKCGMKQPWILMSTSDLGLIAETQPYDTVVVDVDIPQSLRQGEKLA